jgi:hypothetical protein
MQLLEELNTAWTQLPSAVELVKAGAADYLAKPWDDRKLLTCVQNLLELSATRRELARRRADERRRRTELEQRYDLHGAVFSDPATEPRLEPTGWPELVERCAPRSRSRSTGRSPTRPRASIRLSSSRRW